MKPVDFSNPFDYENGFYLTARAERIGKFAAQAELFRRSLAAPGSIVECGVYKASSLMRFIKLRKVFGQEMKKKVIAFDTFGAFPPAAYPPDRARRAKFVREGGLNSIATARLKSCLRRLGLFRNVDIVKGDILKTARDFRRRHPRMRISFLHVDVDLYEPTRAVLEELFPLMSRGGIVLLDDYGKFAGATKAIREYFRQERKHYPVKIRKLPFSDLVSFIEVI